MRAFAGSSTTESTATTSPARACRRSSPPTSSCGRSAGRFSADCSPSSGADGSEWDALGVGVRAQAGARLPTSGGGGSLRRGTRVHRRLPRHVQLSSPAILRTPRLRRLRHPGRQSARTRQALPGKAAELPRRFSAACRPPTFPMRGLARGAAPGRLSRHYPCRRICATKAATERPWREFKGAQAMKAAITADKAAALIPDGARLLIGGFMGVGSPASPDRRAGQARREEPHHHRQRHRACPAGASAS